jgi:hypothetical protein
MDSVWIMEALLSRPARPVSAQRYCVALSSTLSRDTTEFPGLKFAIRQGEVKDVPPDPEAAAFIVASVSIREVPEPQSEPKCQDT